MQINHIYTLSSFFLSIVSYCYPCCHQFFLSDFDKYVQLRSTRCVCCLFIAIALLCVARRARFSRRPLLAWLTLYMQPETTEILMLTVRIYIQCC